MSENICPYKDGELIFVKNDKKGEWRLRYSKGYLEGNKAVCYSHQLKSGFINCFWYHHAPAKGVKLPSNDR